MKIYFPFIALVVFSLKVTAQIIGPGNLRYINDYPIYVDGGCSFFNEINTPLEEKKYQLIISYQLNPRAPRVAFMQAGPHKFIYFKKTGRIKTTKGYIDYFKGKDGSFILTIDSISKINSWSSIRSGTLKINIKGINSGGVLKVHGRVEEADL